MEAAHIRPYSEIGSNNPSNGLLLHADVHTLFDLNFVGIEPANHTVRVSHALWGTVYWELDGRKLSQPDDPQAQPDISALETRWKLFAEGMNGSS